MHARIYVPLAGAVLALVLAAPALGETAPPVSAAKPVAVAMIAKPAATVALPALAPKVDTQPAGSAPKVDDAISGGHTTAAEKAADWKAPVAEEEKEEPFADKLPTRPGEAEETTSLADLDPMTRLQDLIVMTPEEAREDRPASPMTAGLETKPPVAEKITDVDKDAGQNDVSKQDMLSADADSAVSKSSYTSGGISVEHTVYGDGTSVTWESNMSGDTLLTIRDATGATTRQELLTNESIHIVIVSDDSTPLPDALATRSEPRDQAEVAEGRERQISLDNEDKRDMPLVHLDPVEVAAAAGANLTDGLIEPAEEGTTVAGADESDVPSLADRHGNGDPDDGNDDPQPKPNE
jgi:hypothetical protein